MNFIARETSTSRRVGSQVNKSGSFGKVGLNTMTMVDKSLDKNQKPIRNTLGGVPGVLTRRDSLKSGRLFAGNSIVNSLAFDPKLSNAVDAEL